MTTLHTRDTLRAALVAHAIEVQAIGNRLARFDTKAAVAVRRQAAALAQCIRAMPSVVGDPLRVELNTFFNLVPYGSPLPPEEPLAKAVDGCNETFVPMALREAMREAEGQTT